MGCSNEGSSVRVVEGDDLRDDRQGFYAGVENAIGTISIGYKPELHDDDGVMAPVHMVDDGIDVDDAIDDGNDEVDVFAGWSEKQTIAILDQSVGVRGKGERLIVRNCGGRPDLFYDEDDAGLFTPNDGDSSNIFGLSARVREDGFPGHDF